MVDDDSNNNDNKMSEAPTKPRVRRKKVIPSVDYLLKHGDPNTAHLPKTWCQMIAGPLALAMTFALSLFIFHNAPHDKAPPRKKYTLPNLKRMQIFDKQIRAARAQKAEMDTETSSEL
eukprot:jgi/Psemu1/301649/fgenesh1_kg.41_\